MADSIDQSKRAVGRIEKPGLKKNVKKLKMLLTEAILEHHTELQKNLVASLPAPEYQ